MRLSVGRSSATPSSDNSDQTVSLYFRRDELSNLGLHLDGSTVRTVVGTSDARNAGVRVSWKLIAIDGKPFQSSMDISSGE